MKNLHALTSALISLAMISSAFAKPKTSETSAAPSLKNNPFAKESSLPYHLPPFDKIKNGDFMPAIEAGMKENLKEIKAIATNSQPPTFDNTIVAMERSGTLLDRAHRTFSNLNACNTNPEMQKIEKDLAPKLAAHHDAVFLDGQLFARVEKLYADKDKLGLDPQSSYLLERYYKDFVRAGAKLSAPDKEKLKAMNAELATLQTTFEQNVLKEKNASSVVVADKNELAGLTDNEIAAAAAAAKDEKQDGKFSIRLQNTTGQPITGSMQNRALREKVLEASMARNSKGGTFDNRAVVIRIAQLRAQRATLLGYENHAAYQLEDQTAGNVPTVNKLLADLAPPAVANARNESADMQKIVDEEKGGFSVASWDWDFYSEKVRKARYAFDESEIKPYFELNHVILDGVFYAAGKLYGLTFKERRMCVSSKSMTRTASRSRSSSAITTRALRNAAAPG